MHRSRDESRWPPTRHASVRDFLSTIPSSGAHAINIGGLRLDLLIKDRGADATLIVFHGALAPSHITVPVFQGGAAAAAAEMNLIAVADPSLEMGDVDLAWFLGNRWIGPLRPRLSPVLHHVLRALDSKRTVLLGGSGGGFAAILFAPDFPGSAVLALNPRLDLTALPFAKVDQYLRVCHKATGPTSRARLRAAFVPDRISDVLDEAPDFDLLIWQNTSDSTFYRHQLLPFLSAVGSNERVHVRLDDFGPGHKPVPSALVWEALSRLASATDVRSGIEQAGFSEYGAEATGAVH